MRSEEKIQPKDFSFRGFLRLTRIQNLLIIVATQYTAAIFLVGPNSDWKHFLTDPNLFLVAFSSILIAAAGYIINDYYDIKIDLINKPEKVIVGTILKRRTAIIAHTFFNFLGIGLGLVVGFRIAAINFLAAFFLWLYSNQLKRLPFVGNLMVATLTGMSVIVITVYYQQRFNLILLYAIFAFIVTLLREIIKDMEDLRGDAQFGSRTLPIVWGIRGSKIFIYLLSLLFGAFLVYLKIAFDFPQSIAVFLIFILPAIGLNLLLYRADTQTRFHNLSLYVKWFMLLGILSMTLVTS